MESGHGTLDRFTKSMRRVTDNSHSELMWSLVIILVQFCVGYTWQHHVGLGNILFHVKILLQFGRHETLHMITPVIILYIYRWRCLYSTARLLGCAEALLVTNKVVVPMMLWSSKSHHFNYLGPCFTLYWWLLSNHTNNGPSPWNVHHNSKGGIYYHRANLVVGTISNTIQLA